MSSLAQDLIRWEKGELTLEEVERAHPEAGVRDLMRLHTRLSMLRAIPLPDVDRAWSMTLPRLEGPPAPGSQPVRVLKRSSRLRDWARRPIAASFAAVVMSGGMAYAAGVEPVQRAVDGMVDRARDMTGFGNKSDGEDEFNAATSEDSIDETTNDGDVTTDSDETEEHGKSESRGNSAAHRKDDENRHRGHVNKKDGKPKDKESHPGKADAPGLTGENPGKGTPPVSPGTDDSSKPDKDKNDSAAPGAGNAEVHVDRPDESTVGGGAAPAPAAPGASGEAHGNGNGSGKDKNKPALN